MSNIAIVTPTTGDPNRIKLWLKNLNFFLEAFWESDQKERILCSTDIYIVVGNHLPIDEKDLIRYELREITKSFELSWRYRNVSGQVICYPEVMSHVEGIRLGVTTALTAKDDLYSHILLLEDDAFLLDPKFIYEEIFLPTLDGNIVVSYAQNCPEKIQETLGGWEKPSEFDENGPGIWPQCLFLTRKQALEWIVEEDLISPRKDEHGAYDTFGWLGKHIRENFPDTRVIPSCRYNIRDFSKRPNLVSKFLEKHPNPYQLHVGNMTFVYTTLLADKNGINPFSGKKALPINKLTCNQWGNVPCTLGYYFATADKDEPRYSMWEELRKKVIALDKENELLIFRYEDDWRKVIDVYLTGRKYYL